MSKHTNYCAAVLIIVGAGMAFAACSDGGGDNSTPSDSGGTGGTSAGTGGLSSAGTAGDTSTGGTSTGGSAGEPGTGGSGTGGAPACTDDTSTSCYECAPTTYVQILNHCTAADCQPFDNSQLSMLGTNGALPPLQ